MNTFIVRQQLLMLIYRPFLSTRHLPYVLLLLAFIGMDIVWGVEAFAGTTGQDDFSGVLDKFLEVFKGSVSKIIALVAFVFGLIRCFWNFSAQVVAGSFGIALACQFGPDIIMSTAGALV